MRLITASNKELDTFIFLFLSNFVLEKMFMSFSLNNENPNKIKLNDSGAVAVPPEPLIQSLITRNLIASQETTREAEIHN